MISPYLRSMRPVVLICLLCLSHLLSAQETNTGDEPNPRKGFQKERLFTGGGATINFGTGVTVLGASPILGYRITDSWSAGVGVSAMYFRQVFVNGAEFSTFFYGGNAFTRLQLLNVPSIGSVFAQSEFHVINTDAYDQLNGRSLGRRNIPVWLIGGGLRQRLGNRMSGLFTILWDVIDDPNSPYINPFINFGVVVGF